MRRYLFNGDLSLLPQKDYDVVIIGSGIAGIYAALHIDPSLKVALVTKVDLTAGSSYYAQGGIAAVISPTDNFDSHIEDTLTAGAGLCDEDAVRVLVEEGPENIGELCMLNVPFDTNPEGELQITREGGHSCRRIVHCGGDATGRETTKRLGQIAMTKENIDIFFNTYLVDVLTNDDKVCGAIIRGEKMEVLHSPSIILATGGIGYLYKYTTNPNGAVGDGLACAVRAGAKAENMEMVQFHPTTLYAPTSSDRLFLISEAVRGEGGILRNADGEAFMADKHKLKDLAPRDIVTRHILNEITRRNETNAFLDVSSMSEEFFSKRFPTIFEECRKAGINVPEECIPVRPAQHYMMGGIKTDLDGMTNIEGLYSCGEAACTGIHGANRLASNSVLECLVFGRRAARHINAAKRTQIELPVIEHKDYHSISTTAEIGLDCNTIRKTMTDYANAVRRPSGLQKGLDIIRILKAKYDDIELNCKEAYEVCNMTVTAELVFEAAIARKESIGAHYIVED